MAKKPQPKKDQGGMLVRRTFDGPSKAPYGGRMEFQEEGFHSKPDGTPAEGKFGEKRRKLATMTDAEKDAMFFPHTEKDLK